MWEKRQERLRGRRTAMRSARHPPAQTSPSNPHSPACPPKTPNAFSWVLGMSRCAELEFRVALSQHRPQGRDLHVRVRAPPVRRRRRRIRVLRCGAFGVPRLPRRGLQHRARRRQSVSEWQRKRSERQCLPSPSPRLRGWCRAGPLRAAGAHGRRPAALRPGRCGGSVSGCASSRRRRRRRSVLDCGGGGGGSASIARR